MNIAQNTVHVCNNRLTAQKVFYADIAELLDRDLACNQVIQCRDNLQLRACSLSQINNLGYLGSGDRGHRDNNLVNLLLLHNPRNIITVTQYRYTQNGQVIFICTVINESNQPGAREGRSCQFFGNQDSAISGPDNKCMKLRILIVAPVTAEDSPEKAYAPTSSRTVSIDRMAMLNGTRSGRMI